MMKKLIWIVLLGAFALGGCASSETRDPRDPLEPWNRGVFSFNDGLDRAVLKPVAKGYKTVTPDFMQTHVSNFFNNVGGAGSTINAGLQLKGEKFATGVFRLGVNTIFGFGGLIDIASEIGLDDAQEDFGQTLGYWGVPSGPYIVWPFLGPSTPRDTVGLVGDAFANPLNYSGEDAITYGALALGTIDLRARLLVAEKAAESSVIDRYIFMRDAYLQRRQNLVYDGNPPMEAMPNAEEFEFDDGEL